MKLNIKALSLFLVITLLFAFAPMNTIALSEENVISDPIAEREEQSYVDENTEETETLYFEYTEGSTDNNGSRLIPEVGFGPSDPSTDPTLISSLTVPDGVYSLENLGNAGLWMDIQQSKTDPGYHVQQYAYSDNPAGTLFDRAGLFKISRKSNGLYIIRLMLNNSLSFGFSGNEVITKVIPTDDYLVEDEDTFTITYNSAGGYIIKPYESTYAVSANNTTASGAAGAPNSYLAKRTTAAAGTRAIWKMYKYNDYQKSGITVSYPASYTSVGIPVGTAGSMGIKTWSTRVGYNTPSLSIYTGLNTMVSADFDTKEMSFTALSPGSITVSAKILVRESGASVLEERLSFVVIPQEGNYIIRNVGTDKYVDIFGSSTIERALIIQSNSNIYDSQKWIIEHVANGQGYVRIKSEYSGKYIGIDSSDNSSIRQYSTQNNYTLWKFERTDSGSLKLLCKALSNTLVLSPPSTSNGTYLELTTYSNDSDYSDEWVLKSNKYSFTIYHYIDDGYEIRFGSTGQDVAEYQNICSEILHELFDIESTYTVSRYYSCADICTGIPATLSNTTTVCTHSNIDHKTRLKIKNDIVSQFNYGNDTTAKIAWTGHVLESRSSCSYSSSHIIVMTIGMVTDENNNNKSTDIIRYQRIHTLLHEISHQLGAPDHYCYDENSSDCNNPTNDCWRCDNNLSSPPVCIMMSRIHDIEDRLSSGNVDTLYCNQCTSSIHSKGILTHLEDHHK